MKEDEIIEGNKLIAEFMGYKRIGNSTWKYQYWTNGSRSYHDDTIKYNTSWDWLMEVVEKIETSADQDTGHCEVTITENNCRIHRFSYVKEFIKTYNSGSKIMAVWEAVVLFIKWYNDQKYK